MLRKIHAVLLALTLIACGSSHTSPAPTPGLRGTWSGIYTSVNNSRFSIAIDMEVVNQTKDNFSGAWKMTGDVDWSLDSVVEGYINLSNDGLSLANFTLTSGGAILCWIPLFGLVEHAQQSLSVFGYLINDSVTDEYAYFRSGCSISDGGEMMLTRQTTP